MYSSSWNRLGLIAPIFTPCLSATLRSASQSSTRSHGMWMATVGQIPVRRFTIPASASFSSMVRAAPGCANTLKRVPELPYPQEGVSTRSPLMRSITRASVKVKDLRQHLMEARIGLDGLLHDRSHLQLPAQRVVVL